MKIKIFIEEVVVEGQITHRSAADIGVKIINPFDNLSTGLHIPYFSRPYISFEDEYGDETAESLLKELYDIGRYIDTNLVKIRKKLDHAKNSVRNIPNKFEKEEFNIKRKELKQLLKQKELDNREYQKQLTSLRKKHQECNDKVDEIMDDFFEKSFPMIIPLGIREEVMDIIEGKKSLTKKSTGR